MMTGRKRRRKRRSGPARRTPSTKHRKNPGTEQEEDGEDGEEEHVLLFLLPLFFFSPRRTRRLAEYDADAADTSTPRTRRTTEEEKVGQEARPTVFTTRQPPPTSLSARPRPVSFGPLRATGRPAGGNVNAASAQGPRQHGKQLPGLLEPAQIRKKKSKVRRSD